MMLSTTDWFVGRRVVRFPGVASADVVLGPQGGATSPLPSATCPAALARDRRERSSDFRNSTREHLKIR